MNFFEFGSGFLGADDSECLGGVAPNVHRWRTVLKDEFAECFDGVCKSSEVVRRLSTVNVLVGLAGIAKMIATGKIFSRERFKMVLTGV